MRASPFLWVVIGLAFAGDIGVLRAGPGKDGERIAALIRQLGDKEFAKRQAATKELEIIGLPALDVLRKTAASQESLETRRRAEQLIRAIEKIPVRLTSAYFSPGLPLAESKHPVHSINIAANVNARGEGKAKITLILSPPLYDEYGGLLNGRDTGGMDVAKKNPRPPLVLDCTVEFVKAGVSARADEPPIERLVFRLKGAKITSALFVATEGPGLTTGRLLVLGKDQRVEHVVDLTDAKPREQFPPPCHPGCFPAGTLVAVPGGTKRIELIRAGESVTTIGADGRAARAVVQSVFTAKNRLVEVRTAAGTLTTTEAQPLCLTDATARRAGDLKAGDRIWQWRNGRRVETVVRDVAATGKEEAVFNLVVGESAVFVAGNFLARGKPPAAGVPAAVGAASPMRPPSSP